MFRRFGWLRRLRKILPRTLQARLTLAFVAVIALLLGLVSPFVTVTPKTTSTSACAVRSAMRFSKFGSFIAASTRGLVVPSGSMTDAEPAARSVNDSRNATTVLCRSARSVSCRRVK